MADEPFSLILESVIEVSQTVVSSVEPYPVQLHGARFIQPFLLLTASLDASVRVFAPESVEAEGPFSSVVTLQPHLIGSQGFHGAFWQCRGGDREIFAYGYHGAMFRWKEASNSIEEGAKMAENESKMAENESKMAENESKMAENESNSIENEPKSLESQFNSIEPSSNSLENEPHSIESPSNSIEPFYHMGSFTLLSFVSGHFASARAGFSRFGHLLISCSLDRTVRLWGREHRDGRWKEVGRPVVHGYPVTGVSWLKDHRGMEGLGLSNEEIGRLVTINEEKKCRVYETTYLNLFVLNELVESVDSAVIKHPSIERILFFEIR